MLKMREKVQRLLPGRVDRLRGGLLLVAFLTAAGSCAACSKAARPEVAPPPGGPRPGLSAEQVGQFERGKAIFLHAYIAAEGMGPHFNQTSCASCHGIPAPGGHDGMAKAARISLRNNDMSGYPQQAVAGFAVQTVPAGLPVSLHRPPPLFGLGLLQEVPDSAIAGACGRDDALGIHGKPNYNAGERAVGRFGYKAHTSSVRNFIGNALVLEMGMTNPAERDPHNQRDLDGVPDPEMATATVDDLTAYVVGLAPPSPPPAHPEAEQLFAQVGCANCHRPQTGPGVRAFSDLCVHDLGAGFDNGLTDFAAGPRQWRTAPLWGLRWRTKYFHDDRADSLADAIARHDGEAAKVRERFAALSPASQQVLLEWLKTL